MTADLLFEIGVEEMPAPAVLPALRQLEVRLQSGLAELRLEPADITTYGTPRRLSVFIKDVTRQQPDIEEEFKGPPASAAFDNDGNPTKAALGFARGKGLEVADLEVRDTDKGAYVFARVTQAGQPALQVLPELLESVARSLTFPKTMRWGEGDFRFARPIRWIVALLGEEVIPVEIAGVRAGRVTYGHRFLSQGPVELSRPSDYLEALEEAGVIADHHRRRKMIAEQARVVAQEHGGEVRLDDDLLTEVNFMVEMPTCLCGSFDERFLDLPEDVVVTVMSAHQRYFPVENASGALMPLFIAVRNGDDKGLDVVREGNERVIQARLSDAEFYMREDLRVALADRLDGLKRVTYIEGMGSLYDKARRLGPLVRWLGEAAPVSEQELQTAARAALLAKCDLTTNMIADTKLATLQGRIGGEYARRTGEPEEVAQAIAEQYQPRGASDVPPATNAGRLVALADKMDHIAACFLLGLRPTGSADPHALRRDAQGIVTILLDARWRVDMPEFIETALAEIVGLESPTYAKAGLPDALPPEQAALQIAEFLLQRLEGDLAERGVSYDLARAVLAAPCPDLLDAYDRALALAQVREQDEHFEAVIIAAERCANIVRPVRAEQELSLAPEMLVEPAAVALHDAYHEQQQRVEEALEGEARDYAAAWQALSALRGPIDTFFDDVLVMAEDETVRSNRLALVGAVDDAFLRLLDVKKVVLEGANDQQ